MASSSPSSPDGLRAGSRSRAKRRPLVTLSVAMETALLLSVAMVTEALPAGLMNHLPEERAAVTQADAGRVPSAPGGAEEPAPGGPGSSTKSRQAEAPCNCSGEGAIDPDDCDQTTGQCSCLPGYTGVQCDLCEEGYFNNGSTGCLPCACDSFGAVDHRCDSSGICTCKTGVYGPQCDECHPGFFHFSNTGCQPCRCNNHSSYCHPQSGTCLDCQGNTQGPGCEECKASFYRSVAGSLTDDCVPCPCSTTTSTGTCHIGLTGFPVCDRCQPGYDGPTCNGCADGFYRWAGGCRHCECNGNADPRASGRLCHPDTGYCQNCINNTAGAHCELCAPGYTGSALGDGCSLAATTMLGTTTSAAVVILRPGSATRANSSDSRSLGTPTPFTSLDGSTDNSTAAIAAVSWAQFNIIILAVIVAAVALLMGAAAAVYAYREYQNRKLNAPFWTIELKEDNISFSSYHDSLPNADVSGLLEDEAGQAAPNGQLALSSPANVYKA